jgi:hypothetical protein
VINVVIVAALNSGLVDVYRLGVLDEAALFGAAVALFFGFVVFGVLSAMD